VSSGEGAVNGEGVKFTVTDFYGILVSCVSLRSVRCLTLFVPLLASLLIRAYLPAVEPRLLTALPLSFFFHPPFAFS